MKSIKKSLKINILSNWASLGVSIVIGILLTPYIIRRLGQSGYGIWTLVSSFTGYFGLLNLGVTSAITRYVARMTVLDDKKGINRIVSTSFAFFIITGLFTNLICILFANELAVFFNIDDHEVNSFIQLVWTIGVTTLFGFICSVYTASITARENFLTINIITILRSLLRVGLVIFFIDRGYGLVGVGLAPLISTFFSLIILQFAFRKYNGDILIRFKYVEVKSLKLLITYGLLTTIIQVANLLRIQLDSIVIGRFLSVEEVGIYGVAAIIIRYFSQIVTAAMRVLNPRFSSLDGMNEKDKIKILFMKSLNMSSVLSFGICVAIFFFGPRFILYWAGNEYTGAINVLLILSISYSLSLAQNPAVSLMYALNKHKYYALLTILEALINVTLSIILCRKLGIIGVALGTMISMIFIKVMFIPLFIRRIVDVRVTEYFNALLRPFLLSIIPILMLFYLDINSMIMTSDLKIYLLFFSIYCFLFFGYLALRFLRIKKT